MVRTQDSWSDFGEAVQNDSLISRQGPQCRTCKLILALDREASFQLVKALESPEMASTSIRRALVERIDPRQVPSAYSISRHRRGDCRRGGAGPK